MLLFFFNDTATTEIYTLSLHDALPISNGLLRHGRGRRLLSADKTQSNLRAHFRAFGRYCRCDCGNLATLPHRRHARETGCLQPTSASSADARTLPIPTTTAPRPPRAPR